MSVMMMTSCVWWLNCFLIVKTLKTKKKPMRICSASELRGSCVYSRGYITTCNFITSLLSYFDSYCVNIQGGHVVFINILHVLVKLL